jgi:adenylyltransferase/sulfurtransferase
MSAMSLREGRFARFEAIPWWDQDRLRSARVLVIGAGALGNEVLKNLALLGVGHLAIADQDHVELSNLSRSVLYRETDEGLPKAECAARAMHSLHAETHVTPLVGNVLADLGLGWFRWADVVVGALDNREARVFVNSACARAARPWVDGGIEVLQGIVRGFAPPVTACYECTMSQVDWDLLQKRRSCSMLARRALAERGTPTTPTTASVIGGIQAQEVVKMLHGMEALQGRGFFFDGVSHQSYAMGYPVHPDCPWHEPVMDIVPLSGCGSDTPLSRVADEAAQRLGGFDAFEFSREVVEAMECPACGNRAEVWSAADHVRESDLVCAACGNECAPRFCHSLSQSSAALGRTPRTVGLPRWDILWARHGATTIGLELAGDSPFPQMNAP